MVPIPNNNQEQEARPERQQEKTKTSYRARPLHNCDLFLHQTHSSFTSMTENLKKSMINNVMIKNPQETMTKLTLINMIQRSKGRWIQSYSSDLIPSDTGDNIYITVSSLN